MKFSTILIIAGIIIMIIGGIVLMDNVQEDDIHKNNVQINNGQGNGEDRFKPHLVDLDDATQRANNLGKPRLPAVNPVMVFFTGIVMLVVGVYDARRTPSTEK